VACKAVTIGLLVSLLFLVEGMLCVLMSAPLFYAIASRLVNTMRKAGDPDDSGKITLRSCVILLLIAPMSLEGVTEIHDRQSRRVRGGITDRRCFTRRVERALFEAPRSIVFGPLYLRAGFPSLSRLESSTTF